MWADTTSQLLPKEKRKSTGLSRLAKKYSNPIGTIDSIPHRILKNTGKSGLTPLSSLVPPHLSKDQLTIYQKRRYYGFSAAELEKLEAMTGLENRDMKSGLTNPIHPMYLRSQWEKREEMPRHRGPIPIRGDEEGYWLAENPAVWKILEPSLRLASLILTNANYLPWWDALLNGTYNDIPSHRIPPPNTSSLLISFHQRPSEIRNTPAAINLVQSQLITAARKIKFRFISGYTNCNTDLPGKEVFHFAETQKEIWNGPNGVVRINLAVEVMQPLLISNLTDPERIAGQFRVAATLIHETAHAVWETIKTSIKPPPAVEPYFEGEVLCELGWSLEDKLWGGEPLDIVQPPYSRGGPGLPHMGNFKTSWFTDRHTNYAQGSIPLLDHIHPIPEGQIDPYYCFDYWPIPVTWTYSLFQAQLWNSTIRQFGSKVTEMGPLSVGTRRFADDPVDAGFQMLIGPNQHITVEVDIWSNMSAEQQTYFRVENLRRSRAMQIYQSMTQSTESSSHPPNPLLEKDEDFNEKAEVLIFECPRWDEITQYLFTNRGPLELAFDTMTFDIPEPTLYRYVIDRGGLAITPEEFRQFLLFTNNKKQLFSYNPFPGLGTITQLPTGWPSSTTYTIKRLGPPHPQAFLNFKLTMHDAQVQERLYAEFGEFRDLDCETLRDFVNAYLPPSDRIAASEIELVVSECARTGQFLALGPKRIARLTFKIKDEFRKCWQSEFSKRKIERNAATVREANEVEERMTQEEVDRQIEEDLRDGVEVGLSGSFYLDDLYVEDDADLGGLDLGASSPSVNGKGK